MESQMKIAINGDDVFFEYLTYKCRCLKFEATAGLKQVQIGIPVENGNIDTIRDIINIKNIGANYPSLNIFFNGQLKKLKIIGLETRIYHEEGSQSGFMPKFASSSIDVIFTTGP